VDAGSLVPVPIGTVQTGANETSIIYKTDANGDDVLEFAAKNGRYHNWLPAIDFDMSPIKNVKLRASYSQTITRPDYGSLQGGTSVAQLIRFGVGNADVGDPSLLPYKSYNVDLSAEWYYGPTSYISVGFFHKS